MRHSSISVSRAIRSKKKMRLKQQKLAPARVLLALMLTRLSTAQWSRSRWCNSHLSSGRAITPNGDMAEELRWYRRCPGRPPPAATKRTERDTSTEGMLNPSLGGPHFIVHRNQRSQRTVTQQNVTMESRQCAVSATTPRNQNILSQACRARGQVPRQSRTGTFSESPFLAMLSCLLRK